ncbi:MAG: ribonuclease III [Alphaproteobacteria bacterium]|nr:ribonuclease III [Alphaproteobacteria bacterium]
MINETTPSPEKLAQKLGHTFASPKLLEDALTHPSLSGTRTRNKGAPYERLEFLGDRVLGLVIAEWLYESFPSAAEGEMAKRHAALVNRDALRNVAQHIGLADFVRLAHGERPQASRKNLATLSDAMEAVIGALYLDGGFEPAKTFIHRYWEHDVAVDEAPDDPKTALQEWAQGKGLPLPAYSVLDTQGPAHAPKFTVEVRVKGLPPEQAKGHSKREAQKAAALKLLKAIQKK